jgi:hypothetical protein
VDNTQVERDNPHRGSRQERNVDLGSDRDRHRVTVMTLMTPIYELILDEGMRLYFVGSLTLST